MKVYTLEEIEENKCPKCGIDVSYTITYKIKYNEHWAMLFFINEYEEVNYYASDILIVKCNVCGYERICYCKDYDPIKAEDDNLKEHDYRGESV
jgi:hypothetical protein